jgi:hypothetical protein
MDASAWLLTSSIAVNEPAAPTSAADTEDSRRPKAAQYPSRALPKAAATTPDISADSVAGADGGATRAACPAMTNDAARNADGGTSNVPVAIAPSCRTG